MHAKEQGHQYSRGQVEFFVRLAKKGDASSLTMLRQKLGKTQKEIASNVGVSERQLRRWEEEEQQPSDIHLDYWKLGLGGYIDPLISELLGTEDMDAITRFWEQVD